MENNPIGIFDSGVGGITVLRAIRNLLPNENLVYFGDTGRVPYGSKSPEIITNYSVQIANFLADKDVKSLVIACNSASARASKVLEDIMDVPVFGVIKPAVIGAVASSKNGKIGVIGTKNTIESSAHRNAILGINPDLEVYSVACPMIAPYVEEAETQSPAFKLEVSRYLSGLLDKGIDTLILGCTHYPLVKDIIQEVTGDGVHLIDPSTSVAEEVYNKVKHTNLKDKNGKLVFYVTGGVKEFSQQLERFGLPDVHIHQVEIVNLNTHPEVQRAEEYAIDFLF